MADLMFEIYVIWHDWASYHDATFTDRKAAAVVAAVVAAG